MSQRGTIVNVKNSIKHLIFVINLATQAEFISLGGKTGIRNRAQARLLAQLNQIAEDISLTNQQRDTKINQIKLQQNQSSLLDVLLHKNKKDIEAEATISDLEKKIELLTKQFDLVNCLIENFDKKIVVVNPLDNGDTRSEIEHCIRDCTPINQSELSSVLNFDNSSKERDKFISLVTEEASNGRRLSILERDLSTKIKNLTSDIEAENESIESNKSLIKILEDIRDGKKTFERSSTLYTKIVANRARRIAEKNAAKDIKSASIEDLAKKIAKYQTEITEIGAKNKEIAYAPTPYEKQDTSYKNPITLNFKYNGPPITKCELTSTHKDCKIPGIDLPNNTYSDKGEMKCRYGWQPKTDEIINTLGNNTSFSINFISLKGTLWNWESTYGYNWWGKVTAKMQPYIIEKNKPENFKLVQDNKNSIADHEISTKTLENEILNLNKQIEEIKKEKLDFSDAAERKCYAEAEIKRVQECIATSLAKINQKTIEKGNLQPELNTIIKELLPNRKSYSIIGKIIGTIGLDLVPTIDQQTKQPKKLDSVLLKSFIEEFPFQEPVLQPNPPTHQQQPTVKNQQNVPKPLPLTEQNHNILKIEEFLLCSHTKKLMRNPVLSVSCGHIVEESELVSRLAINPTCPIDPSKKITALTIPLDDMRMRINTYLETHAIHDRVSLFRLQNENPEIKRKKLDQALKIIEKEISECNDNLLTLNTNKNKILEMLAKMSSPAPTLLPSLENIPPLSPMAGRAGDALLAAPQTIFWKPFCPIHKDDPKLQSIFNTKKEAEYCLEYYEHKGEGHEGNEAIPVTATK